MKPQNPLNNKRFLVTAGVVGVLLLIVLLFVFMLRPAGRLKDYPVDVSPISLRGQLGIGTHGNHFYTTNGRQIVKLDPKNGKTETLGSVRKYPDLAKLIIDRSGRYALAMSANQSAIDDLGALLLERNLNMDDPYWWRIDLTSGEPTLLTDGNKPLRLSVDLQQASDNFWGLDEAKSELVKLNGDLKVTMRVSVPERTTSFFVDDEQTIYYTADGAFYKAEISGNKLQKPTKMIGDDVVFAIFAPNGERAFVGSKLSDQPVEGKAISLPDGKELFKRTTDHFSPIWSPSGDRLYLFSSENPVDRFTGVSFVDVNKNEELALTNNNNQNSYSQILAFMGDYLVVSNLDGVVSIVGMDGADTADYELVGDSIGIIENADKTLTLEYDADTGKFTGTAFGLDQQKAIDEIERLLRDRKLNPNLINVNISLINNSSRPYQTNP